MPRLLGVDIPNNKRIAYALKYIYGLGLKRAEIIVEEASLDPAMRSQDITEEQINAITGVIQRHQWKIEGDLRREIIGNVKRLQAVKSYRGIRHHRGLPVRGQRTKTNARTRKGARKTVSAVKK